MADLTDDIGTIPSPVEGVLVGTLVCPALREFHKEDSGASAGIYFLAFVSVCVMVLALNGVSSILHFASAQTMSP